MEANVFMSFSATSAQVSPFNAEIFAEAPGEKLAQVTVK